MHRYYYLLTLMTCHRPPPQRQIKTGPRSQEDNQKPCFRANFTTVSELQPGSEQASCASSEKETNKKKRFLWLALRLVSVPVLRFLGADEAKLCCE